MKNYIIKYSIILLAFITILMSLSFYVRITSKPVDAKIPKEQEDKGFNDAIQINVLNACGVPGLASDTRQYLREIGFDVVEIGNYHENLDESIIIDRIGDKTSAYKLAYVLGMNEQSIITDIDSTLYLRSTIVIGKNYKSMRHFK